MNACSHYGVINRERQSASANRHTVGDIQSQRANTKVNIGGIPFRKHANCTLCILPQADYSSFTFSPRVDQTPGDNHDRFPPFCSNRHFLHYRAYLHLF